MHCGILGDINNNDLKITINEMEHLPIHQKTNFLNSYECINKSSKYMKQKIYI